MLIEKLLRNSLVVKPCRSTLFNSPQRELEGDKYLKRAPRAGYLNAQRAYAETGDSAEEPRSRQS